MAYEDDMIDAGFYDEESYLEYLLDEDDTRSERQRWIEEECSELELMADSGLYTEEELMEEVEERKRMRRQRFIKTGQNKGITPILSDEEEESVGYEYRQEEFEKDEDLISQIYNLVDKVLNEIPLFPTDGFDDDFYDNYDPLELKFGIKVINNKAYIHTFFIEPICYSKPPEIDASLWRVTPTNTFVIKDLTTKDEKGKWIPDMQAIFNMKIYYYPNFYGNYK